MLLSQCFRGGVFHQLKYNYLVHTVEIVILYILNIYTMYDVYISVMKHLQMQSPEYRNKANLSNWTVRTLLVLTVHLQINILVLTLLYLVSYIDVQSYHLQ